MRGHDDGCVKSVSLAVEAQETILDSFTGIDPCEGARTHAGIEPGFDLFIETSVVFFPLRVSPRFGVALEPALTRILKGAAFVPGDRVSEAKGNPIDSAVLFPVGETAASRGVPGHRIPRFRFDVSEQTRMSAPPFQAFVRGIA